MNKGAPGDQNPKWLLLLIRFGPVVQEATWSSQLVTSQEEAGETARFSGNVRKAPHLRGPCLCCISIHRYVCIFPHPFLFPSLIPWGVSLLWRTCCGFLEPLLADSMPALTPSQRGSSLLERLCSFGGVCSWAAVICLRLKYSLCLPALIAKLHSSSLFCSSNDASMLVFGLLSTNSFVNYIKTSFSNVPAVFLFLSLLYGSHRVSWTFLTFIIRFSIFLASFSSADSSSF